MSKIFVVAGGQFGSEGKGAVARWLAQDRPVMSCRVGGPNAGHTAYDRQGRQWKLQQVPVGAIANDAPLVIGQGSEIDLDILNAEIEALDPLFHVADRLAIDKSATVLTSSHALQETGGAPHGEAGLTRAIGSTGKGVGAARASRIWREAETMGQYLVRRTGHVYVTLPQGLHVPVIDTVGTMMDWVQSGEGDLLIEGTQGYGLGLHTDQYPYTTSGDCRAIDFLAQAGISPWASEEIEPWVVFRTYPIRVAGNSGILHGETTWEAIGQPPEMTTVTQKIRRVGQWDSHLARRALFANGCTCAYGSVHCPVRVALLFLDYVFPGLRDCANRETVLLEARSYISDVEEEIDHLIDAVGTGPDTIVRIRD